jgi:hypothetical protein
VPSCQPIKSLTKISFLANKKQQKKSPSGCKYALICPGACNSTGDIKILKPGLGFQKGYPLTTADSQNRSFGWRSKVFCGCTLHNTCLFRNWNVFRVHRKFLQISEKIEMYLRLDGAHFTNPLGKKIICIMIRKSAWRWYDQAEFISTGQSYDWC